MEKLIYEYNVSKENQAEYLRLTREKIKPFWEANGCRSYTVWKAVDSETAFVKEMLFDDMSGMKEITSLKEAEPLKEIFSQFAVDVSKRVITQSV